jgi:hypothetical protein
MGRRHRPEQRRLRDRRDVRGDLVVALAVWRLARIEEKWSAGLRPSEDAGTD